MNLYVKLVAALAVTSGVAAGLLALTYNTTAPIIAQRSLEDQVKALENVFFLQREDGKFQLDAKEVAPGVTALYAGDAEPVYYAATGEATGYNSSVPIRLMVGFTAAGADAAGLLKGYVPDAAMPAAGEKGEYIVGFSVIHSEETPGLGEKIKDSRPAYTWLQAITGSIPPANPDSSTDFQRQFRGRPADSLVLKKNGGDLDAITASTITSNGVIAALRDASGKLQAALGGK